MHLWEGIQGTRYRLLLEMVCLQTGGAAQAAWPFWHEVSHGETHSLTPQSLFTFKYAMTITMELVLLTWRTQKT